MRIGLFAVGVFLADLLAIWLGSGWWQLVLVVALLYLSMQGWPQTFLVLSSLPFAVAGSVWLLAFMDYNLSTAVWVGLIAVTAIAAQTGIVMVVYLDEAFARHLREGRIRTPADVDPAVVEGASARVRPLLMTVATTGLGLLPLLVLRLHGTEIERPLAIVMIGGLVTSTLFTLLALPTFYLFVHDLGVRWRPAARRPLTDPIGGS